jgi:glycosyltransferase involved in cell wall biosynthesis
LEEAMPTYGYYMADLTRTRTDSHGIINYSLGLLTSLAHSLQEGERLVVLGSDAIRAEFEDLLPGCSRFDWHITRQPRSVPERLATDHFLSLWWARRTGVDVLHFPKGFIPVWRCRKPRIVATIHDDIPLRYAAGDFGKRAVSWRARYFAMQTRHALRRADAVIAVSDFARERLQAVQVGRAANITTTYQGVLPVVSAHRHKWPKKPQLLVMGSTHPHKQTRTTIEYARRYAIESNRDLQLLVLGKLSADVEALVKSTPAAANETGILSNHELVERIAESAALLFGSSYEGFGLPPLEAALLGTPAVYRRSAAVEEIMGRTHFPFGGSYEEFAAALDAALAATEADLIRFRDALGERFDWIRVAERTLNTYRSVLQGDPSLRGPVAGSTHDVD